MALTNDMIGREQVVQDLLKTVHLLRNSPQGFTLCLNGRWGSGKTYVLKELEERLKNETLRANTTYNGNDKYLVLHYNCWQYDYYEEPLAAIVSVFKEEIDRILDPISPGTYAKADKILKAVVTLLGAIMVQITAKNLHLPDDFADRLSKIKTHRNNINKLLEFLGDEKTSYADQLAPFTEAIRNAGKALDLITREDRYNYKIVLVVDELDRCLPSYAIKVLERLHHLFDQRDNCVVILALDKPQLAHSIKACFGPRTDVNVYLKKFINFTYNLDIGRYHNGVFKDKYSSYFKLFQITNEQYQQQRGYLAALFSRIDMRSQELLFTQAEMLHRFIYPGNTQSPADLLLLEMTAVVFSHYERTHPRECKWEHLMRFPFKIVVSQNGANGRRTETKTLEPIYEEMTTLSKYFCKHFGSLKDCNGKLKFTNTTNFSCILLKSFEQSFDGKGINSLELMKLDFSSAPASAEMIQYIKTLRESW